MIVRVQILGKIEGTLFTGEIDYNNPHPVTFHSFATAEIFYIMGFYLNPANAGKMAISLCDAGTNPRRGEWHEPLAHNAITNVSLCDNVMQCYALFNSENNVGNNYCPAM
jgi:hypothetical protein